MRVSVLPATAVDKAYTYSVPEGMDAPAVGTYVEIPLGPRKVLGCVWDDAADDVPAAKLKEITQIFDAVPPLADAQRRFIERVAAYTVSERGEVLKMALSAPKALTAKRPSKKLMAPCANPDVERAGASLTPEQEYAAGRLRDAVAAGAYSCTLVDGVTGAGKTEVYFEAVAEALRAGKQALILLPEIALSNAFLGRFAERFGCLPALWHSGLTEAPRKVTWKAVATGESRVVIGARSALFLPYADLGVIVVDEEHDSAFKQEDGVRYNARDMAVLRGHITGHAVVLVSATPSLETFQNVRARRYDVVHLPDRFGGARLPDVSLIDMKATPPERGNFISPPLKDAIAQTLASGEQALLFLNRRGYAPLTLCRACGHRIECPHCSAWMVEHKQSRRLTCHHCGTSQFKPDKCPKCAAVDSLVPIGPGVERIAEEARDMFPQARTLVLASDTAGDDGAALHQALEAIRSHNVDIIIGTQIIAKGHHFPKLTLVGVVDADLGLQGGDLRASERTWQLLHQVAGRAGREAAQGRVLLQTFMPENRVMQSLCAHDRDAFVAVELEERAQAHMPPYGRLAAIILSGTNPMVVEQAARALVQAAPEAAGLGILGPAQAAIYKLRNHFRWRLLLSADRAFPMQDYIRDWMGAVKTPSTVRVAVDIDPYSFL
ncbi:MAG: primosomal protein N' [Alphaproteobacteria bacterium]|nr:primosomal protein N' [Alphaproteobacteria bacterium]